MYEIGSMARKTGEDAHLASVTLNEVGVLVEHAGKIEIRAETLEAALSIALKVIITLNIDDAEAKLLGQLERLRQKQSELETAPPSDAFN